MFPPLKEKLRFRGGATKKSKRESIKGHEVDHPLRKPLYLLSAIILMVFGYFVFFNGQSASDDPSTMQAVIINESTGFSTRTQALYRDFLRQLKVSRHNTPRVLKNKLTLPGNALFTRTKTVQMLFDYVQSATYDLYASEYAADPNYHYVECVETFAPHSKEILPKIEVAVREFLRTKGDTLYSQDIIQRHCEKVPVTDELQQGLKVWPGQHGLIVKEDLPAFTCIGHYYGDEYILNEYEKQFDWSIYGKQTGHPWRRKWDYYLTIPYHSFADERLNIPENVTVAIDAYHAYNYSAYVNIGGQELSWEQSKVKMGNLEEIINDPRKDLYKAKMWPEDLERKNTEFVYCSVDGVLQTFVTTTKPVAKGKQLFIYYGPNYG